jgi:hypothetical protein
MRRLLATRFQLEHVMNRFSIQMHVRFSCVAVLLGLAAMGCGTTANLVSSNPEEGGKTPFGGVRQDLSCFQQASTGAAGLRVHPNSESESYRQHALMTFCAIDLPLSLIGDLVMWPYTAAYAYINQPTSTPPVTQEATEARPQALP